MPNVSSFGAQTDNSVVKGTVTDRAMIIPDIPPQGLMSVGPRVTPHFVKPSLWSALTTYHFFDAVHDASGASYVAIKPEIPAGTELTDEGYWFLWADPNSQFADLSELVKTYNGRITQNTEDIATKAPNNHASEDTTYGVGNEVNYGHVRLATKDTPLTSGANDGIAVTPNTVNKFITDKTKMIAFGDSFGDESGEWADLLSKSLGLELDNYCLGGATWPFDSKLTECISNYSTREKNEIAFAIAYGGINTTVFTELTAAPIIEFIKRFNNAFPGIPLYIAPLNNCDPQNTNFPNAYSNTMKSAPAVYRDLRISDGKFTLLENSWLYCTGANDLRKDDKLHPNEKGSMIIANNMQSAMHGNTLYQELQYFGEGIDGTNVIKTSPGYITRDGIYTPSLIIKNATKKRLIYFLRNGFPNTSLNNLYCFDHDTTSESYTRKDDVPCQFEFDASNPQYLISLQPTIIPENHEYVFPSQFVPFTA